MIVISTERRLKRSVMMPANGEVTIDATPRDEADGADLEGGAAELVDEEALRGELHPLAEHRADVADPEHAEVRVLAERGERARAEAAQTGAVARTGGRRD